MHSFLLFPEAVGSAGDVSEHMIIWCDPLMFLLSVLNLTLQMSL